MAEGMAEPFRCFNLDTAHNFRDIGGYPTQDGFKVKWRLVFRSGAMARIAGEEERTLRALGITTICDFRTNEERIRRPTVWHRNDPTELLERNYDLSVGALTTLINRSDTDAEKMRAMFLDVYRQLPFEQAESYQALFKRIAEARLPLIFNCSAGKDRTGVAAALLLTILRVPRPLIIEDYLVTNDSIHRLIPMLSDDPVYGGFITERTEVAMPLLRAEADYLAEAFAAIEARHESIDTYLEVVLGVTPAMQDAIRSALLE